MFATASRSSFEPLRRTDRQRPHWRRSAIASRLVKASRQILAHPKSAANPNLNSPAIIVLCRLSISAATFEITPIAICGSSPQPAKGIRRKYHRLDTRIVFRLAAALHRELAAENRWLGEPEYPRGSRLNS
jgi:hypothetical protein